MCIIRVSEKYLMPFTRYADPFVDIDVCIQIFSNVGENAWKDRKDRLLQREENFSNIVTQTYLYRCI